MFRCEVALRRVVLRVIVSCCGALRRSAVCCIVMDCYAWCCDVSSCCGVSCRRVLYDVAFCVGVLRCCIVLCRLFMRCAVRRRAVLGRDAVWCDVLRGVVLCVWYRAHAMCCGESRCVIVLSRVCDA